MQPSPSREASPQSTEQPQAQPDVGALADQRLVSLLALLLFLSLLGNLPLFWRRRKERPLKVQVKANTEQPLTNSQQWRNFQKACADNHARKADEFLRKWAQQRFDKRLIALGDLARWLAHGNQVDQELQQQLNDLQQSLFSASKPKWTGGKALYQSLRKALDNQPKPKQRNDLPELY